MTVKDSPDTRIKAADAKPLLELKPGLETWNQLHRLVNAHGMKAVGCIVVNRGREPLVDVAAHTEDDRLVLNEYLMGYVKHMTPDGVRALHGALILAVRDDGEIDTATWGSDKTACDAVAEYRDIMLDELPAAPFQTWFGWGFHGRPKRLAADELAMLGEEGRAYVERNTHRRAMR